MNYTVVLPTIIVMPGTDISASQGATLLDVLLSEHLITPVQVDDIKVKSASQGVTQEEVLNSLGIIPPNKISEAKAKLLGIPYISLTSISFSP